MKSVLLVFDDQRELDFIDVNLSENGFNVFKTESLLNAIKASECVIPDLIVVNTCNNESELQMFIRQIKTERLKNVSILSLVELEYYLKASEKEFFVVKPLRPKLLLSLIRGVMNNESINWLPSFH